MKLYPFPHLDLVPDVHTPEQYSQQGVHDQQDDYGHNDVDALQQLLVQVLVHRPEVDGVGRNEPVAGEEGQVTSLTHRAFWSTARGHLGKRTHGNNNLKT